MGKYTDNNLIRYEDAIQLHLDENGWIAWLVLKNYGVVFHKYKWAHPWNEVRQVTIGIPAGSFSLAEAQEYSPHGNTHWGFVYQTPIAR